MRPGCRCWSTPRPSCRRRKTSSRFIEAGADLVAFSGGKAIGGPQASGILCGRRYLVMAAALQNLDLDVFYELWAPPMHFIDKTRLKGLPQHGIGRSCKVGKEEIVGLLTALRLFVEEDGGARRARWRGLMQELADGLAGLAHAKVSLLDEGEVPEVALDLDEAAAGVGALEVMKRLEQGTPAVFADPAAIDQGRILFGPMSLKDGEPARIAERLRGAARPRRLIRHSRWPDAVRQGRDRDRRRARHRRRDRRAAGRGRCARRHRRHARRGRRGDRKAACGTRRGDVRRRRRQPQGRGRRPGRDDAAAFRPGRHPGPERRHLPVHHARGHRGRGVGCGARRQPARLLPGDPGLRASDARATLRADRADQLDHRAARLQPRPRATTRRARPGSTA